MEKEHTPIGEHQRFGLSLERHQLELEAEQQACTRLSERREISRQLAAVRAEIARLAAGSAAPSPPSG